ncbi:MAG: preprotein translocase subunit SecE [Chlamydiae bacterium]|nr:preprotein translocase subunit SecE [Chlamydiota bacterium]
MDQISLSTRKEERAKAVSLRAFFSDVKQEFKKIAWTSKTETIVYTKVVFAAIFLGGFALYLMDLLIHKALWIMSALVRSTGG